MDNQPESNLKIDQLTALLNDRMVSEILPHDARMLLEHFGAAAALFSQNTPDSVAGLLETVLRHPTPEVRNLCQMLLEALVRQGNPTAASALCELAIRSDNPRAVQFTIAQGCMPENPDRVSAYLLLSGQFSALRAMPNAWRELTAAYQAAPMDVRHRMVKAAQAQGLNEWALVVRAAIDEDPEALTSLATALPLFSDETLRSLAFRMLAESAVTPDSPARPALFDLFIESDYAPARALILEQNILPAAPVRRAALLLLTQQWPELEQLDFTGALAAQAYEGASPALRRRMVAAARRGGRIDWLQNLTRGRRSRWLGDLSDTDWFTIFEILTRSARWADLWRLAQSAPPVWAAPMLAQLKKSGFLVPDNSGTTGFENLLALADDCLGISLSLHSPQLRELPGQECNCLAISPDGRHLAVGTSRSGMAVFNLPDRQPDLALSNPPGPIWALAYDQDQQHLVSAHGDFKIRVWNALTDRLVKTLSGHTGVVRSLALTADQRLLISAGFDGLVRTWRFPAGPELKVLSGQQGEIFSVAVSPDGSAAASGGSDKLLRIWSLTSGSLVSSQPGHTATITSLAVSQDGSFLASASRDTTVRIWAFPEGSPVAVVSGHDQLVTQVVFHPEGHLGASVSYDGRLLIWTVPEAQELQSIDCAAGPLVGVAFSPIGNAIFTLSKSGLLQEWDLRPLIWTRLPIERLRQADLSKLEATLTDPSLGTAEQRWLSFTLALARWRSRHDIGLVEPEHIQVGEFDIEIEDLPSPLQTNN